MIAAYIIVLWIAFLWYLGDHCKQFITQDSRQQMSYSDFLFVGILIPLAIMGIIAHLNVNAGKMLFENPLVAQAIGKVVSQIRQIGK